jgi:hypothetical protein
MNPFESNGPPLPGSQPSSLSGLPPASLAQLLRQAAAELQAQPAPPLPAAVLSALPGPLAASPAVAAAGRAGQRAAGAWAARSGPRLATAAVALSVLLVAATSLLLMSAPPTDPLHSPVARGGAAGFVPVAPRERWERLHDEGGAAWVVNTEMQQQRLAHWGLPYDPARAADPVRAELLMRASGEVLAVRVLH